MPVLNPTKMPSYCRHKGKNRAFVRLGGETIYLGSYGSAASHEAYDKLIKEWLANGRTLPEPPVSLCYFSFSWRPKTIQRNERTLFA